jgi:hypothetical protein
MSSMPLNARICVLRHFVPKNVFSVGGKRVLLLERNSVRNKGVLVLVCKWFWRSHLFSPYFSDKWVIQRKSDSCITNCLNCLNSSYIISISSYNLEQFILLYEQLYTYYILYRNCVYKLIGEIYKKRCAVFGDGDEEQHFIPPKFRRRTQLINFSIIVDTESFKYGF